MRWVLGASLVLFPLYYAVVGTRLDPAVSALVLGSLLVARILGWTDGPTRVRLPALAGAVMLVALMLAFRNDWLLRLYPALASFALAFACALTLRYPPPAIERVAVRMGMSVEGPAVPYTRRLTLVWSVVLAVNGAIAAYTATLEVATWALYNGFLCYLLMGGVFLVEYPIRLRYQRRHGT